MDGNVVLPNSGDDEGFLELARTPSGKVFRKQILKMNSKFLHPANKSQKITIDKPFAEKLVENFKAGYCDIVQFPMVNAKNQHVEDPASNLGEVVDLTYDDDGVWAYIDVRKNSDDVGKTILGASAMMSLDYEDKTNGNHVGPTLLHVAGTNRPYLTNLAPYEAVSLSDGNNDDNYVVMLSDDDEDKTSGKESDTQEGDSAMDRLAEILDELKNTFDIDVEELQKAQKKEADEKAENEEPEAEADTETKDEVEAKDKKDEEVKTKETVAASDVSDDLTDLVTKLSDVLKSADSDLVALSDADLTISDVANGVIELSNNYSTMKNTVDGLNRKSAEADVDNAVREGRVLPAQRDAMVELKLSNAEMYERLIPEEPIVKLSNEEGISVHDAGNNGQAVDEVAAEIKRIADRLNNK